MDEFVKKIVSDPSNPPDTLLLNGYLGASSEDGHTRLYFDAQLSRYVEIPDEAILHKVAQPEGQNPLGGHYVWIQQDAELVYGKAGTENRPKAKFFEGAIMQTYGAAVPQAGAARPAQAMPPGQQAQPDYTPASQFAGWCTSFTTACQSQFVSCPSQFTICRSQLVLCQSQQIACQSQWLCPSQTVICQSQICPSFSGRCPSAVDACPSWGFCEPTRTIIPETIQPGPFAAPQMQNMAQGMAQPQADAYQLTTRIAQACYAQPIPQSQLATICASQWIQLCPSQVTLCRSQQIACQSQQLICQSQYICPSQTVICQSQLCPSVAIACPSWVDGCPSQGWCGDPWRDRFPGGTIGFPGGMNAPQVQAQVQPQAVQPQADAFQLQSRFCYAEPIASRFGINCPSRFQEWCQVQPTRFQQLCQPTQFGPCQSLGWPAGGTPVTMIPCCPSAFPPQCQTVATPWQCPPPSADPFTLCQSVPVQTCQFATASGPNCF